MYTSYLNDNSIRFPSYCSGFLNQDGFEVLLMALGYHVHEKDINQCLKDIGTYEGKVSFNSFFNWWTSDEVGASYLKRK